MLCTEVSILLSPPHLDPAFKARADIVLAGLLVVHDIKIVVIPRDNRLALQMPSRKVTDYCRACSANCALLDRFCAACGEPVEFRAPEKRSDCYRDLIHPTNQESRVAIERIVLGCFELESRHQAASLNYEWTWARYAVFDVADGAGKLGSWPMGAEDTSSLSFKFREQRKDG